MIHLALPGASRVAVVDLGSNTCRLVVYRVDADRSYYLEDEIRELVRLRAGFTEAGLAPAAMRRAIAALRLFRRFCDQLGVRTVVPTATSAVRDAANGAAFVEEVRAEIGWELQILSAEEEARYGSLAVLEEVPMSEGYTVDIGGGSAQLSRIKGGVWVAGDALPLGALRLTEQFMPSDPPARNEVSALRREIRSQIGALGWARPRKGAVLAGIGGTIRNLASIDQKDRSWPFSTLRGYVMSRGSLDRVVELLMSTPVGDRRKIAGLNPDRADIIPSGAIVLQEVMEALGMPGVHVSVAGLREGLFLSRFRSSGDSPRGADLRRFSVHNLGRRYGLREDHADRVASLALRLFEDLEPLHGLDASYRDILWAGAWLHDVGVVISYHSHHKHSQFLIAENGLAGFSARETALVAQAARYHRKGTPTADQFEDLLSGGDARALEWMAAFARTAEYLERGRTGTVSDLQAQLRGDEIHILIVAQGDTSLEIWDTQRNALPLLEQVCGRTVRLVAL